jgi:hypothetical protein
MGRESVPLASDEGLCIYRIPTGSKEVLQE